MGGNSQDVKRLKKNMGFLPSMHQVFLTTYICFALMEIIMRFKHLEVSHIMAFKLVLSFKYRYGLIQDPF